jgi:hypothetical protein
MSWLLAALLLVRIGTRSAARRDADEAHRNLAQLLSELVHYRAG